MGDVKVYDADQINISLAGIPMSGYADGEFLRIEREGPAFDDVVGTDGEVTRSKTNDNRATATVRLMQSSDSNDLLSVLHNLDKNVPGGPGIGPFMARDNQGRAIFTAEKAWIMQEPDVVFDRTATEREWQIRLGNYVSFHGGN